MTNKFALDLDAIPYNDAGDLSQAEITGGQIRYAARNCLNDFAVRNGHQKILLAIADQLDPQGGRIPEPRCGALVKASCVHGDAVKTWVRISDLWYVVDAARADAPDGWDDLVDPVLVREGV